MKYSISGFCKLNTPTLNKRSEMQCDVRICYTLRELILSPMAANIKNPIYNVKSPTKHSHVSSFASILSNNWFAVMLKGMVIFLPSVALKIVATPGT